MIDLLLRNARVGDDEPLVDIAIAGATIYAVGQSLPLSAGREIDLSGAVVVPGFVDPHQHVDKAHSYAAIGYADGLEQAIQRVIDYRKRVTEDDIYRRGHRLISELLRFGVCAVRTHCEVEPDFGLRGLEVLLTLKREFSDRIHLQLVALPTTVPPEHPVGEALLRRALEMGCEVIGGVPAVSASPSAHVDAVMRLARDFNCLVDLHVDEMAAPTLTLPYVAEATVREGLQGRVTCSHCCALSLLSDLEADRVIEQVQRAALHIVACPLTNLYLQGGAGRVPGFRGLTRVNDLVKADVNVALGSDNIRDPFNPYGNGDPLLTAVVGGTAARLGSLEQLRWLLHSVTHAGAQALRLANYGLARGCRADVVALACETLAEVVPAMAERRLVILSGRVIAGGHAVPNVAAGTP